MLIKEGKIVILDIEGNSAKTKESERITQFAALIIENNEQKEICFYNRNVEVINPIVAKMNKITVDYLKKYGISERRLALEIYQVLENAEAIYAYGYDYDKTMIKKLLAKYGYKIVTDSWIDIQLVASELLNPASKKLKLLAKSLDFKESNFHNALTDVKAIFHIINHLDALEVKV